MRMIELIRTVLMVFVFMSLLVACKGGDDADPYQECLKDSDCGAGFKCVYQECKRIIDGDDPLPSDGDETDGDADQDLLPTDGDVDEEPTIDGDGEEIGDDDVEGAESTESDVEAEGCTGDNLDPQCGDFVSQVFCRDGQVSHDVMVCKGSQLYQCKQLFDCNYPNCGYVISELPRNTCSEGCVSNPDPEQDDYCLEDGPPDGDADTVDSDTPPDGDADDDAWELDRPNHQDGYPCSTADDCLPGHACQLDWDDNGRYCAPDSFTCVDHVDLAEGDPAALYDHSDKICHGQGYKRCSSGTWLAEVICPQDACISGYLLWEGQNCVNFAGCVPNPREDPAPCPGNFSCFDDSNCRGSCGPNSDCRPDYICVDNACIEDVK